jgi:hypothetical protein
VKGIVDRVDELFKKKKDEVTRTLWDIADAQNQLDYLNKSTETLAQNNAYTASVINWLRNSFGNAVKMIDEIEKNDGRELNELQKFKHLGVVHSERLFLLFFLVCLFLLFSSFRKGIFFWFS